MELTENCHRLISVPLVQSPGSKTFFILWLFGIFYSQTSMDLYHIDEETFDFLTSGPNTLRHIFLKFIEELIRHVMWEMQGVQLRTVFEEPSYFVVPLYRKDIGNAIYLLINLIDEDIKELYESIKEKIKMAVHLKPFISRLADVTFGHSSHHLMLFLAITSRIFTLVDTPSYAKANFIETVAYVLEEKKVRIIEMGGFESMDKLASHIMKDADVLNEFRGLKCGKASDFFQTFHM